MAYKHFRRRCLEEQLLLMYYVINHLILLKIQNMMDIKEVLVQWFINCYYKKSSGGGTKSEIYVKSVITRTTARDIH